MILNLDQECKCGNKSYLWKKNTGNVVGLYCSKCGHFLKWASKDEKNLIFIMENSTYGIGEYNAD